MNREDFELGLLVRIALLPGPWKKLVGYSFNGTVLPPLPEWDREKYPYAYIGKPIYRMLDLQFPEYEYFLISADTPAYYAESVQIQWLAYNEPWELKIYGTKAGSPWTLLTTQTSGSNRWWIAEDIWTNTDVLTEEGEVYLAASEPVPFYG